jgi:alanine dehydrogenase
MNLLVLNAAEVERLLDDDALLDALADGFRALSAGEVVAPERNEVTVPAGFVLAMPAWRAGDAIAVKLVSVFHGNAALGISGHQALIALLDPSTGTPLAIMDGTYITARRTAAGAALSARLLARPDAGVLAIIGAGVQGQAHLRLLSRVRPIREVRIASLELTDAERLAASDPRARAVASYAEAVRGADIVCLCTTSSTPVVAYAELQAGTHVTSVGYMPPGGELDPAIIARGRLFVETREAFASPPVGCDELVGLDPAVGTELGELLLGRRPGRHAPDELTVYKSMGHAVEDLVAAQLVFDAARKLGIGTELPF